jgi:hypothetical protein
VEISYTKLLLWVGSIAASFPVIIIGILYGKIFHPVRWLSVSLIVTLVLEIVSKVLWTLQMNNMPLFHLHTLMEFILITLFFSVIVPFPSSRLVVLIVSVFVLLWSVPFVYDVSALLLYNSFSRSVASAVFILYALLFLLNSLKNTAVRDDKPLRLIIFAILTYSVTSLLIFSSAKYIQSLSMDLNKAVWSVHGFIMLLYNVLISVGLWRLQKRKLSSL